MKPLLLQKFLYHMSLMLPLQQLYLCYMNLKLLLQQLYMLNLHRAYGVAESTIPKQPVEIVGGIIKIGLNIVGLIFLALMIYGGFLWMTARGEEAKVTKSKELLEAAIIGLVIVFAAYGITYFVVNQLMTNVISGGGAV